MPWQIGAWRGEDAPAIDRASLAVLGVDDLVNRVYVRDPSSSPVPGSSSVVDFQGPGTKDQGRPPVALYIGYYKSQRQGDTIHSPLNCLPGSGWEPINRTRIAIPVERAPGDPVTVEVNRLVIQKGMDRDIVLYWYQSHGRVVSSEYWGRAWMIADAIRMNRTDGALVRLIAPIGFESGAEAASQREATAFVQAIFPLLGAYIPN